MAGATDDLATCARYVSVLAALLTVTVGGMASELLLKPSRFVAMPERFAGAMTRARLNWFVHGPKPLSVAFDHARTHPTTIPFFWEAEDGSTIRRMPDGSFRMESWSAAANWTTYIVCEPAGWPTFACKDGSMHQMSAPDLSTVIFAGRTFTRILPATDAPDLSQR